MEKLMFRTLFLFFIVTTAQASFFPQNSLESLQKIKTSTPTKHKLDLLSSFERQMAPLVKARGAHLKVILDESNNTVNATAKREDQDWQIIVYKGLLSHPMLSEKEITLILCHELGHHLGGNPTAARGGWASCEGQADYWSTHSCYKLFHDDFEGRQAALNLTSMYALITNSAHPSLESREEKKPIRTLYGYPSPQCRLDTLLAGFGKAPRPMCWYIEQ